MRISIVQDALRMGGTERQSIQLANAYAEAGHTVQLLTFRPGGALASTVAPQVQHVTLQSRDRGIDWWAPKLRRTLRSARPDVVQLMGRTVQIVGWHLPRALPEARFVATFRTGKPIPWLHRLTLRRAHAIVVNSREARVRLARDYGIAGPQVRVIYNAVSAPQPAPPQARDELRREFGTSAAAIVFLCTAMLRPEKGHRELLHTFADLKLELPWELWVAGDGSDLPVCRELVARLGLGACVKFLGLRHDVARLYAAADVAVLTSRSESLPNFLVEAQWLGVPVVATEVAGVGESFAPDESGVLIRAGDRAGFCAALQRLARDRGLRARMAAAARAYAAREFEPAVLNRRYLELFAELLART